jgi:(p)ppGpp synthase/HD superfamily hydrolase
MMTNNLTTHPVLSTRFERALVYAHHLHQTQLRKGTQVPYISHLLSVAALVLEAGGTEDAAIAALLHDAVEDQGGLATREAIYVQFGESVVSIIDSCTEPITQPKLSWQERKQHYLAQLPQATAAAQCVIMADKLHNARSILADVRREGDRAWHKFKAGRTSTLWFYRECLTRLQNQHQNQSPPSMLAELQRVIEALEQS